MSTTPTPSFLGEGDLDSTKGHSQLSVGTLPLTDNNLPENTQEKDLPPSPSEVEGPNLTSSRDISDNPPSPRDKETVTTPPPEELEHVTTPPSHSREDSPTNYPPEDHPESPISSGDGSVVPPAYKSQSVPPDTLSLDFGQDKQLTYQIKTKREIDSQIKNLNGDIQ